MKYNDNGTYKDIYVKALDTLPVGAEFDYIGERVPDGYVQVESYSTNEVNTGQTWIDGKPIYRKVLVFPAQAIDNTTTLNTGITNMELCIKFNFIFHDARTTSLTFIDMFNVLIASNNTSLLSPRLTNSGENIGFRGTDSYGSLEGRDAIFILEYTKTTD